MQSPGRVMSSLSELMFLEAFIAKASETSGSRSNQGLSKGGKSRSQARSKDKLTLHYCVSTCMRESCCESAQKAARHANRPGPSFSKATAAFMETGKFCLILAKSTFLGAVHAQQGGGLLTCLQDILSLSIDKNDYPR